MRKLRPTKPVVESFHKGRLYAQLSHDDQPGALYLSSGATIVALASGVALLHDDALQSGRYIDVEGDYVIVAVEDLPEDLHALAMAT